MPKVSSNQRCGHCQTCLNPRMKKACITVREKQKRQLEATGDLPLAMLADSRPGPKRQRQHSPEPLLRQKPAAISRPAQAAEQPQQQPTDTPLSKELDSITEDSNDGTTVLVAPVHTKRLVGLLRSTSKIKDRSTLLGLVESLDAPSMERFTHADGLLALQTWLQEAVDKSLTWFAAEILKVHSQPPCLKHVMLLWPPAVSAWKDIRLGMQQSPG